MRKWSLNPSRTFWLTWAIISTVLAIVLLWQMPPIRAHALDTTASENDRAHITAFPLQLGPGLEGIAVIDKHNYTICIYLYQPRRPAHERFELVAARNFRYDCQLQQFNTTPPLETVKQWLLRTGQPENESSQDQQPEESPEPDKITDQGELENALMDNSAVDTEK